MNDISYRSGRFIVPLIIGGAILLSGCHKPVQLSSTFVIGTTTGTVWVAPGSARMLPAALKSIHYTMERSIRSLDFSDPDSDITKINNTADAVRMPLSSDTFRILDLAVHYSELAHGTFDISTVPLEYLWGFKGGDIPDEAPSPDLIKAAMIGMGIQNVHLFDQGSIAFVSPQTRIDLGALAASYALDLSIVQLKRDKISDIMIRFGNTTRSLGAANKDTPWTTEVANPFDPSVKLGTLALAKGMALVTMRLYDQSVVIGDKTYGSILDPRTGRPANDTAGVSVIAPTATQGYSLAYALSVMGLHEGEEILDAFPRCGVLIVPDRQPEELWMTDHFTSAFRPSVDYVGNLHAWHHDEDIPGAASTNQAPGATK